MICQKTPCIFQQRFFLDSAGGHDYLFSLPTTFWNRFTWEFRIPRGSKCSWSSELNSRADLPHSLFSPLRAFNYLMKITYTCSFKNIARANLVSKEIYIYEYMKSYSVKLLLESCRFHRDSQVIIMIKFVITLITIFQ